MREKLIKKIGRVIEARPNTQFLVELEDGTQLRAYLSGKMIQNRINVLVGDRVEMELPVAMKIENTIARITFRLK